MAMQLYTIDAMGAPCHHLGEFETEAQVKSACDQMDRDFLGTVATYCVFDSVEQADMLWEKIYAA